jgi:hypothetical protein
MCYIVWMSYKVGEKVYPVWDKLPEHFLRERLGGVSYGIVTEVNAAYPHWPYYVSFYDNKNNLIITAWVKLSEIESDKDRKQTQFKKTLEEL